MMICPRCNNQDPKYFYTFNGITYCRKCINIGMAPSTIDRAGVLNEKVSFHLTYQLTTKQQELSQQLLQRYILHLDTSLKAVCGAGKTEITYAVIEYALNQGHQVGFTTPRKELVIELAKRLQSQFSNLKVTSVYGGHCKKTTGPLIVCTTHQLYRYVDFFDLLILDEQDAFPYSDNSVLHNLLTNSIRGNLIKMSATLEQLPDLSLSRRYHGGLLDIPKCYFINPLLMYLMAFKLILRYRKQEKPVLVFVPKIDFSIQFHRYLKILGIKNQAVSSKVQNVHQIIDQLKSKQIDVIVTTSILERGITIDNVQVIVLHGENKIFSPATLIQICGRVGRKKEHPQGEITIFATYKTKAIKQCLKTIKQDNA